MGEECYPDSSVVPWCGHSPSQRGHARSRAPPPHSTHESGAVAGADRRGRSIEEVLGWHRLRSSTTRRRGHLVGFHDAQVCCGWLAGVSQRTVADYRHVRRGRGDGVRPCSSRRGDDLAERFSVVSRFGDYRDVEWIGRTYINVSVGRTSDLNRLFR
jgi:hypothetical protein